MELCHTIAFRVVDDVYASKQALNPVSDLQRPYSGAEDVVLDICGLSSIGVDPRSPESRFSMHLTLQNYSLTPLNQSRSQPDSPQIPFAWLLYLQRAAAMERLRLLNLEDFSDPSSLTTRDIFESKMD